MLVRRNWLLRASVFINAAVLLYFVCYIATIRNGSLEILEEMPSSSAVRKSDDGGPKIAPSIASITGYEQQQQQSTQQQNQIGGGGGLIAAPIDIVAEPLLANDQSAQSSPVMLNSLLIQGTGTGTSRVSTTLKSSADLAASSMMSSSAEVTEPSTSLKEIIPCHDKDNRFRIGQKGDFWVLYNYVVPVVVGNNTVRCYDTITYTTHADYTFIDNLEPLVKRWQGPVSLAMYAPGTDFAPTLNTIRYLRKCGSPLIAQWVSFHLYFGSKHVPKAIPKSEHALADDYVIVNCSLPPPWSNVSVASLYKTQKKLLYPVNVGRNIARDTALTYYILPSDIELYPSPGIITDFMDMIRRQDGPLLHKKPKVFPLAIFEVEANLTPPENKKQLVQMLRNHSAIPFHKKVCPGCHNFPKSKEWIAAPIKPGVRVFHIGKRLGNFVRWEPVFIGTHSDPYYDERLSWEGKSDKMTQGYALCVLDYEFQILDNAFLVHKPGIKTLKKDTARAILTGRTNTLIRKVIYPELKVLYGIRKGCAV